MPGTLASIEGAQLSSVRLIDGRATVRVWNDDVTHSRLASIDGAEVTLGAAEIRQIALQSDE
jgi:hypothetical protein